MQIYVFAFLLFTFKEAKDWLKTILEMFSPSKCQQHSASGGDGRTRWSSLPEE